MLNQNVIDDLKYARDLAQEGVNTPLVGGRIGLMWGILLAIVFFAQWAVLSKVLTIPVSNLIYFWIAFAVIGGAGTALLGRKAAEMEGAHSVGNKVDGTVWGMFSLMMGTLFLGVLLNVALNSGSPTLFSVMLPVGFAGQALAYGLVARISKIRWMNLAMLANCLCSIICFVFYGSVTVYLIGSIGVILTVVIPSLIIIKQEPNHDV